MISIAAWLAGLVSALLLLVNLRRLLFLAAAAYDLLVARQASRPPETLADILVLVPLRNEATSLPGLIASLLALDYPRERLTIGLIDDGSDDGSGALIDRYAASYAHIEALHNPTGLGKANALKAGLRCWPQGEIVVVYDADTRPEPDSLWRLVAALRDPEVAAAGGLIRPANGLATPIATYAALERLVHQQVTMRAKDRLGLAPAMLGSHCAYRRRELQAAGGFPSGAYLEDSHLTVLLARRGYRLRFLPEAVASDQVPETLPGYWRQHVRWSRGFHEVAGGQLRGGEQPAGRGAQPASVAEDSTATSADRPGRRWRGWLLRLELWLFSLGYLDRLALLAGLGLLLWQSLVTGRWTASRPDQPRPTGSSAQEGASSAWRTLLAGLIGLNLLLPSGQIVLTLLAERASLAWWLRLLWMPFFFAVDIAAAVWSSVLSLAGRPRVWLPTERGAATGPVAQCRQVGG